MRDPRHAPAESCMRRCLPILALALLLARPALAQEQPVDAQGDEPPTGAIEPEDDPEAAESAASAVPLEEIKRYVSVFMAVKEAYVEPVDDKALMDSAIRGLDRTSTRLNSSHYCASRIPSSA